MFWKEMPLGLVASGGGGERLVNDAVDWYGGAGDCGGRAERGGRCPRWSMVGVAGKRDWYQRMQAERKERVIRTAWRE